MADVGFRFIRDRVCEMEKFGEDLISIIIPVYNSAGTLRRCMDSIVNQTYGRLEIILVESASVDGSAALCDAYAKQDKRVKVIHQQERKGLSNARNTGLTYASGPYVGFVDSDDWVACDMYEALLQLMKKEMADIACGRVIRVSDQGCAPICKGRGRELESGAQGREPTSAKRRPEPSYRVYTQDDFAKLYFRAHSNQTVHYVWNKLYTAKTAKQMVFPEGLIAEDVEGFFLALLHADKIVDADMDVYYYWYNQNGLSSEWFSKKQMDIAAVWKHVWEYCIQYGKDGWVYYAEINYYRAFFGLLCRMIRSGKSSEFPEEKEYLLTNFRKSYGRLMRFPLPAGRKALMTAMYVHFGMTERLVRVGERIAGIMGIKIKHGQVRRGRGR